LNIMRSFLSISTVTARGARKGLFVSAAEDDCFVIPR
jgi:hypothetical protein